MNIVNYPILPSGTVPVIHGDDFTRYDLHPYLNDWADISLNLSHGFFCYRCKNISMYENLDTSRITRIWNFTVEQISLLKRNELLDLSAVSVINNAHFSRLRDKKLIEYMINDTNIPLNAIQQYKIRPSNPLLMPNFDLMFNLLLLASGSALLRYSE